MADDRKMLDTLHRVTTALRDTRERLRATEAASREPIAIVGMGCRLPGGVDDPDALWRLLDDGHEAITSFPTDRGWPGELTGAGGFLSDPAWFDAGFFGIGPREALSMDPQQRLMLEISWEALERAGIDPVGLCGSRTGVFTGSSDQDYRRLLWFRSDEHADHLATATAASVLSGRVAYYLGLHGPALSIDTACSSSLVALHLAVRSLRARECDLALAGGVVVMSAPGLFAAFRQQGALAADGRCKAFAEAADGVGWGEGAGVVVVERLSDALAHGHPVLAVVRGSAVNSDGASNGLTAPNGRAQQRVIRDALADAGLDSHDVDAVEAHGTGTRLGDPIEISALQAAYGRGRENPLPLGSLKSNIGHTQAAAGVAGVLKMVLALRNRSLPSTLHVDRPSSQVDWSIGGVRLLTERQSWPSVDGRPRRAGVSSFGISGTNAHLILEEATAATEVMPAAVEQLPWVLSARSASALRSSAASLQPHADGRDPIALTHALVTTRSTFEHRAVVLDVDPTPALVALSRGTAVPGLVTGTADLAGRVVFVFPGQGGQWPGMASDLLDTSPLFRDQVERCARALDPHTGWDLLAVLRQRPDAPSLDQVDVVQPALFAVMVSLAALWRASGVEPDAVVGHSQGEIAAAHVAGALSLADAALVVARRAKALKTLSGRGGMASVELAADRVEPRLDKRLTIATVNGPESCVVAGDVEALEKLVAELTASGVAARRLAVDYASHSPQVELIREHMLAELAPITPRATGIPFHSAVTGSVLAGAELTAEYWYRNLRMPVRFDRVLAGLPAPEYSFFVEVSPHPVLAHSMAGVVGDGAMVTGTLRRNESGRGSFLTALAHTFVRGQCPTWTAWAGPGRPGFIELPTYPFERQRFWLMPKEARGSGHPFLDAPVELADVDELVLTGRISLAESPWLADHQVLGVVTLPGTAWLELALRAGAAANCPVVEELILQRPLALPDDVAVAVQLRVGAPGKAGRRRLHLHTKVDGARWLRHGEGVLGRIPAEPEPAEPEPAGDWPPEGAELVSHGGLYPVLVGRGLRYGPAFQGLRAVWRRGKDLFAEVTCPLDVHGFTIHPALLDCALHAMSFGDSGTAAEGPMLPFTWTGVTAFATRSATLRVQLRFSAQDTVGLTATDGSGAPVLSAESLVLRPAATRTDAPRDALFRSKWVEAPATSSTAPRVVVAVGMKTDRFPTFADLDALERAVVAGMPVPSSVLVSASDGSVSNSTHRALALVQWWVTHLEFAAAKLVFLTSGAVFARTGDEVGDLAGAAVTGLVRSAQAEEPGRFVLLDADEITPLTVAAALNMGEPEIALRRGLFLARRLVRILPTLPTSFADTDDVVLITGGTGTLGGLLARHLVAEHRVRRLVLASRGGSAPDLLDELADLGATADMVACDVADRAQLTRLLDQHRPTIIVHAAGAIDDGVVTTMTAERLDAVLRPKAEAALLLHELTKDRPLKAFVLFSSAAATAGSAGQSNYAAANAVLDALAHHRCAGGLPGISLAWGLWAEPSNLTRHLEPSPDALSTSEALALFDAAVSLGDPVLTLARMDTQHAGDRPLMRELVDRQDAPDEAVRSRLDRLSRPDQETALIELILSTVASTLGHRDAVELSPNAGFLEMGVDSLAAVRIRNHLAEVLQLRLRATVAFDHAKPVVLARHLADRLVADDETTPEETQESVRELVLRIRYSEEAKNRSYVTALTQLRQLPRPVRLARGDQEPALVCVPGIVGKSDPVQYARLAKSFQGERDVWALRHPGFRRDEALPNSRDLLLDMHVDGLRAELGDRHFVLTGLSAGGLIANLLAWRLCQRGNPPAGVVVLDSYVLNDKRLLPLLPGLGEEAQLRMDNPNFAVPSDDGWVTAMLHYQAFDWMPTEVPVPVLFVRAADPLAGWPPGWEPVWPLSHSLVVAPGNHMTMLEEHAADTAALMNTWMCDTFGRTLPVRVS